MKLTPSEARSLAARLREIVAVQSSLVARGLCARWDFTLAEEIVLSSFLDRVPSGVSPARDSRAR